MRGQGNVSLSGGQAAFADIAVKPVTAEHVTIKQGTPVEMMATKEITTADAAPGIEAIVTLELPPGTTVAEAAARSGLPARHALAPSALGFAIFGQRARADTPLADGDRVELTRPLVADPKAQRRQRARNRPLPRGRPTAK